jgi:hypothetical protein
MSRLSHPRRLGYCATFLLAGLRAAAQYYRTEQEEPHWATMRLEQASLGVYAEAYDLNATTRGAPSYHQSRIFVGPLIGLGLSGSIYHPNLFDYRIDSDGSLGYLDEKFSGTSQSSDTQLRYLGNFSAVGRLLDSKPLNGRVSINYTHTYQDYDFFNRVYIDTLRYGGGLHYTTGPLNFSASLYQDNQDSTGYGTPLKADITTLAFDASHTRPAGSTSVAGSLDSFTRNDYGFPSSGHDYTFSAADSEDFGDKKQYHSLVNLSYNHVEDSSTPIDIYTATGNLRMDHTDRLSSLYTVNYSRNSYTPALVDNVNGSGLLRHRLYDSLTSEFLLEGYRYSASSGANQQDSWQFGGGPGATYVKRLSSTSSLTAYESLVLLHTDVQSTGGVIPVLDEPHSFSGTTHGGPPGSFSLNQPNVVQSSILVTDTSHMPPAGYIRGFDYDVIVNGQLTFIQRRTGSTMPDAVLVNYSFQASPPGSYGTLNNALGVRFDFFDNHWALFTRFNVNQNYGGENMSLQNLDDFVVGTEGNWRFIRAGTEYENYDSSLSPFQALRFFQIFTLKVEENSLLSLNFTETFTSYEQANRSDRNYTGIVRYNRNLSDHWGVILELGANTRVGPGVDQTLAVVRPQFQYVAGTFSATIGYDFGYDEYLNSEQRVRNMGFIRIQKRF